MNITKKRLGAELILQLEDGYVPEKLENWANHFYHDHVRFLDPEVRLVLQDLMSLTMGPEFEMTEEEVRQLAIKLINK